MSSYMLPVKPEITPFVDGCLAGFKCRGRGTIETMLKQLNCSKLNTNNKRDISILNHKML